MAPPFRLLASVETIAPPDVAAEMCRPVVALWGSATLAPSLSASLLEPRQGAASASRSDSAALATPPPFVSRPRPWWLDTIDRARSMAKGKPRTRQQLVLPRACSLSRMVWQSSGIACDTTRVGFPCRGHPRGPEARPSGACTRRSHSWSWCRGAWDYFADDGAPRCRRLASALPPGRRTMRTERDSASGAVRGISPRRDCGSPRSGGVGDLRAAGLRGRR